MQKFLHSKKVILQQFHVYILTSGWCYLICLKIQLVFYVYVNYFDSVYPFLISIAFEYNEHVSYK